MLCCELKSTVKDLASDLKQSALEEVKQKSILGKAYILAGCSNPYGIENLVITKRQNRTEIYYCGELVFLWDYGLKRYICGEWVDILSDRVRAIKSQRKQVQVEDRARSFANNWAMKNYVTC